MDYNDQNPYEQNSGADPYGQNSGTNPYTQSSAPSQDTQAQAQFQQNPYQQSSYQQNPYQQSSYQQNSYQQPQYQNYQSYQPYPGGGLEEPMSVKEWLITDLLLLIPCVNIILVFVWAFSSGEKKSKSNYFKAQLIFIGCILVFYLLLFIIGLGAGLASIFN